MSDEVAHEMDREKPPVETNGRSISLTITLHPNGQLEMSGPINNQVLCHGLLGRAAAHLAELSTLATLKKLQASQGGMSGLLRRMNGG